MKKEAKIILDSSERSADLFWATGFFAPDPIMFVQASEKSFLLANELEFSRAKKSARVDAVLSVEECFKKGTALLGEKSSALPADVVALHMLLQEEHIEHLLVPETFSYCDGSALKKLGYSIASAAPFFPERQAKSAREIRAIAETMRHTETALGKAFDLLRASSIGAKGVLYAGSEKLTAEMFKNVIERSLYEDGCLADHTIVACGNKSAQPHNEGSGPLYAHQPIIIDIFPRSRKTGYFGDITRTFCKGEAPPRLKKMYAAVLAAQNAGLRALRAGITGKDAHAAAARIFEEQGFETGEVGGIPQGFIHALGHSLGLELHEAPYLRTRTEDMIAAGNVVTVEPGLYYPRIGGVRIEDTVVVTQNGYRNLTTFPKETFEIN